MNKFTQLPLPLPDTTAEIPLTKGYIAIVDAIDANLVNRKWHFTNGYATTHKVVINGVIQNETSIHRLILSRVLNRALLPTEFVDHKNGDKLDNRRSNLRLATHSQNMQNRHVSTLKKSTQYKGVSKSSRYRWTATIKVNGKQISLGNFDTPEEAHAAYCEAAAKYHGEFARFA